MIKIKKLKHSQKFPYISINLKNKVHFLKNLNKKEIIKTWSRASTISPAMIGYTISLHNGIKHIPIYITSYHVGHKLGEFVTTRTFYAHKKANIKNNKTLKLKKKK